MGLVTRGAALAQSYPDGSASADRFTRLTWENLFVLTQLEPGKLNRLIEYLLTKTAGLLPAFQLDAW